MAARAGKAKSHLDELRAMSDSKLAEELDEAHRHLFTVRLQLSTRQLQNSSEARKVRRRIARILTLQRERGIAAAYAQATGEGRS